MTDILHPIESSDLISTTADGRTTGLQSTQEPLLESGPMGLTGSEVAEDTGTTRPINLTTVNRETFERIVHTLLAITGPTGVITASEQLQTYECDGLTGMRVTPGLVVLPEKAEQVQEIVRLCLREGIPFVPRGSGTGLSGGALPTEGCLVIGLSRMRKILEVDLINGRVVVEPGVINLHVTQRVSPQGYYYAPDPSSQLVCSIGGNVAENSGGAHCLKYGFTVNHVLGLEMVLPTGELVSIGGKALDTPGYDLVGVVVGSEGTLGVVTKITLRLLRKPETVQTLLAAFEHTDDAGSAVSAIIGAGIVPAAIEMLDHLAIVAVEAATHAGYPLEAGAALVVELDGPQAEVAEQFALVKELCQMSKATNIRVANDADERALIWKGRKAAFAAMGRISPNYYVQDGVIPRTTLPQVLRRIDELSQEYGLRVANVFHAGDGNLHPLVLYDASHEGEDHRAEELAGRILKTCVEFGGSITGEHGVGMDKKVYMPFMFTADDLNTMQLVRCAFNPDNLCNPGKVFPTPRLCGEKPGPARIHPLVEAGLAEMY